MLIDYIDNAIIKIDDFHEGAYEAIRDLTQKKLSQFKKEQTVKLLKHVFNPFAWGYQREAYSAETRNIIINNMRGEAVRDYLKQHNLNEDDVKLSNMERIAIQRQPVPYYIKQPELG